MISKRIVFGLDIGSKRLKASAVLKDKSDGVKLLAVHEAPAYGLSGKDIKDINELAENVSLTLKEVSKKCGRKVKEVRMGICGHLVTSRYSGTIIPLLDRGSKVITAQDVRRVNKQSCLLGTKMEEVIVHAFPVQYTIDDLTATFNPVGLHGRRLEAKFLLVMTQINLLNNFTKAVNLAGYEVDGTCFSSYASAEACLLPRYKKEGCVFIDIGASVTALLFYHDGVLKQLDVLPFGGNFITQAIAQQLDLPLDLAEDIKKSYVDVGEESLQNEKDDEILIKRENRYHPVKRREVNLAVQPNIVELVQRLQEVIGNSPLYHCLNRGIFVAGGSALMPGLIEQIEKTTNLEVNMGKVIAEISRLNKPAVFAAAVGLAQLALQPPSSSSVANNGKLPLSKRLVERAKELYQEYF